MRSHTFTPLAALTALLTTTTLLGCADGEAIQTEATSAGLDACGERTEPQVAMVRKLTFLRDQGGVSPGFDLDGVVTDPTEPKGCRMPDLRDPDGNPGIDNQFARLLPAIDLVGGAEGFESAVQHAINEGSVLLAIELGHMQDPQDDPCISVDLSRAAGRPSIDALGFVEAGQTFERDPDAPSSRVDRASLQGGVLDAGPFELELPMQISTFNLLVTIHDARMRATLLEDGSIHGVLGGGVSIAELIAFLDTIEDGTDLLAIIRTVLTGNADLDPGDDGKCRKISVAVQFEAAPAFFFED